jgi:hypothetical protein
LFFTVKRDEHFPSEKIFRFPHQLAHFLIVD